MCDGRRGVGRLWWLWLWLWLWLLGCGIMGATGAGEMGERPAAALMALMAAVCTWCGGLSSAGRVPRKTGADEVRTGILCERISSLSG